MDVCQKKHAYKYYSLKTFIEVAYLFSVGYFKHHKDRDLVCSSLLYLKHHEQHQYIVNAQ